MADIWEKLKASFDKVSEKALELAKEAAEKTQEQAAVAAVKIEIMKIEKSMTEKLAKIGSVIYEQIKEGRDLEKTEEMEKLVNELKELEAKLKEYKDTLEKSREEKSKDE